MEKKPLATFVLGIAITVVLFASLFLFQIVPNQYVAPATKPAQAPQELQKFKASGFAPNLEGAFLVIDGGKDKGIFAKNGLDPEFIYSSGPSGLVVAADIKAHLTSDIKIGINNGLEPVLARSNGAPVKIVAAFIGETPNKIYVKADSTLKTVNDLDGKKIGVISTTAASYRHVLYMNSKFGIRAEPIPVGNVTNMVVALKLGRIDGFNAAGGAPLRLVDSGELRVLVRIADVLPKPWSSGAIFASEDLIEQDPDLVRRFVKATLETVKYLKDNPSYAAELYMRRANAPRDLAEKVVSELDWAPSGLGSGQDLIAAAKNQWQYSKDTSVIPAGINVNIEEAVDLRFLP